MSEKFRNACYSCAHSRKVPDSMYTECVHPGRYREAPHFVSRVLNSGTTNPTAGREVDRLGGSKAQTSVLPPLNIEAIPHAISSGWFAWPINFDPVWLTNCDGYVKNG